MKKERIYKAHLLFTKEPGRFEVIENGYVAVSADGRVTRVAADLASVQRSTLNAQRLDSEEAEVTDFGQAGSFEPGYEFDALVIGDSDLNHDNYSLLQRLERYIYLGDDRQIEHRFCRGKAI